MANLELDTPMPSLETPLREKLTQTQDHISKVHTYLELIEDALDGAKPATTLDSIVDASAILSIAEDNARFAFSAQERLSVILAKLT